MTYTTDKSITKTVFIQIDELYFSKICLVFQLF